MKNVCQRISFTEGTEVVCLEAFHFPRGWSVLGVLWLRILKGWYVGSRILHRMTAFTI
jgi:hypothetical protein